MGDLYEIDVLEWSAHQARLLRQHAAGEACNEVPDWTNIIEEVESVGRSQLNGNCSPPFVQSFLDTVTAGSIHDGAWTEQPLSPFPAMT